MRFGLPEETIDSILGVFKSEPKINKVILFGSRAKGNYRPGSDIDIAIDANKLTFDEFLALSVKLENLELPQKVDLIDYATIDNHELLEHIARVGIQL